MSQPATKRFEYLSWAALIALGLALMVAVFGCVSMETPKTFNERLAYGYASVAASRNTAAGLLERKRITAQQGKEVQALADNARTLLDGARATMGKGDVKTAEGQLQLALDLLIALETKLKESQ